MKNQLLTTCFFAAVALTPGLAYATDPAEKAIEAHALTDKAAALYDDGGVAFRKSKWAEARAAFLAAWALKQHWQIAANLADCELQLGRFRDAAEHAMYYVKNAPADRSDRAMKLFAEASLKVATLRIDAQPEGAEVFVDGQSIGRAPVSSLVFLDPGEHTITARVSGRPEVARKLSLLAGREDKVKLEVEAAAVAPPPAVLPPLPPPLSSGPSVPLVVGGAAISLAALGTGVALFAVASSRGSDADQMVSQLKSASTPLCAKASTTGVCGDLFSLRQEQGTFHNTGVALLVGGSVAAAGTLVYALWPRGKRATRDAWVVPVVSTGGAGVWMRGTF